MNRVTFLVDGFNLYHSLRDSENSSNPSLPCKWLDIRSFLSSYLPVFGQDAQLCEIYYFSALATHRNRHSSGATTRKHRDYISCLKSTGIRDEMGRFKPKDVWCSTCQSNMKKHEEKETDVAMAVKMMELCHLDSCDTLVIVSGDTDLAPPVRAVKRLFTDKQLAVIFPYKRQNNEMRNLCDFAIKVKAKAYRRYQFPDPVVLSSRSIAKPNGW